MFIVVMCGINAKIHSLIKFWAKKEPEFIFHYAKKAKLIADPFCGSGSSGFSAVLAGASAYLSDINPVSVFIAYNVLNNEILETETIESMKEICYEIEKEVYALDDSKTVNFAVWKNDQVILLKFTSGKTSRDKRHIKDYLSIEKNLQIKSWYPKGKFVYPGTNIEFNDGPHRSIEIKDLFTKRNLYATSKLYSHIEKIWRKDKSQGDLLKLVFIASLANATKMIPHSKSSGPSWKVPRYWIPSLREERNFCRSFLRRLSLLASFKEKWSAIVSKYRVTVSFEGKVNASGKNFVHLCKANALDVYLNLPKLDLIILDPPHYDEINYFEMTYLWQKWLEGSCKDFRFKDYHYWKDEICVNKKVGKDLGLYTTQLYEVISCYSRCLKKNGKIILILHNRDKDTLRKTIKGIKKVVGDCFIIRTKYEFPKIPSSTQGLHGRKKFLCVVKIERTN